MNRKVVSSLEALEQRIAPASITFTSSTDGSATVKVTTSKGSTADLQTLLGTVAYSGTALDLATVNLAGQPVFRGTDLTIELTGAATVSIADLHAAGFDLGTVIVPGEIGHLEAGDSNHATLAIKSLQIGSLATRHEAAATSTIAGSMGTLQVTGDLAGTLLVTSLTTASIGGNLDGTQGTADQLGSIVATGSIGTLTVTGGLLGGAGFKSGSVFSTGTISHATVGRILGGDGQYSGDLSSQGSLPDVKINGGITGNADTGAGTFNGAVLATGKISALAMTGKITGGYAASSGEIASIGGLGTVSVDGGIEGGHGFESGTIGSRGVVSGVTLGVTGGTTDIMKGGDGEKSGSILSSTVISSATIHGNILGGAGNSSGEIASAGTITTAVVHGNVTGGGGIGSGAIGSTKALGDVTVDGNLVGGTNVGAGEIVSSTSMHSVTLHGAIMGGTGDQSGAIGSLGAIGTVTIDHDIEGGAGFQSGAVLSGTSIAKVTVTQGVTGYALDGGTGNDATISARVSLGTVSVGGDLRGGAAEASGTIVGGTVSSVSIGGNIVGGSAGDAGAILAQTSLGTITVTGNVKAGTDVSTGVIESFGTITSVTVNGSLDGTTSGVGGQFSGGIFTQGLGSGGHNIGTIVVRGNVTGGDAYASGSILADGSLGSITIGSTPTVTTLAVGPGGPLTGNLTGGSQTLSGTIFVNGTLTTATVNGSVLGKSGPASGGIFSQGGRIQTVHVVQDVTGGSGTGSGAIQGGSLGTVQIGGNLTGGLADHAGSIVATVTDLGSLQVGGTIRVDASSVTNTIISAQRNIGSVTASAIEGRFRAASANGTPSAVDKVLITAGGNLKAASDAQAVAIGSVTADLDIAYAAIEAGYDISLKPINGHVSIGKVEAGASGSGKSPVWTAVDVLAGVTGHDFTATLNSGGNARLVSTISSIVIHGQLGTDLSGAGHGIVAKHVVAVSANGGPVPLQAGFPNDSIAFPGSADPSLSTVIYEVGAPSRTS